MLAGGLQFKQLQKGSLKEKMRFDIQAHASHVLTRYYIGTTTPNFS